MKAVVENWGDSVAIRLPDHVADELGFRAGTAVEFQKQGDGLLLRHAGKRRRYLLSQLLNECKGAKPHKEAMRGARERELF